MKIWEKNSETKKAIRQQLLAARNQLSEGLRKEYSKQILSRLLDHPWYKEATQVLLYISYGSEADTLELCTNCFQDNKEVYCPRILAPGKMEFYAVHSLDELNPGYRGIKEPPTTRPFRYNEKDPHKTLMIMPLVGFDLEGNRLGYGGGYYDRYLENKGGLNTIALAFGEQCWKETLPKAAFDIRPHIILTPQPLAEKDCID